MKATTARNVSKGTTNAITVTPAAPTSSAVETTGAPAPPVTALITGLALAFTACTPPAISDARDEEQPRLNPTFSGRRDRHESAGGRSHERLDGIVDVVDRRDLVGDEFDGEQHGNQRDEPPRAEQVEGLAQLDPAETLGEGDREKWDVGVDARRSGERDTGQDVHATSTATWLCAIGDQNGDAEHILVARQGFVRRQGEYSDSARPSIDSPATLEGGDRGTRTDHLDTAV